MRRSCGFSLLAVLLLLVPAVALAAQGSVQGLALAPSTAEAGATVTATVTGASPCGAVHIDWGDGTAITYATETLPVTQTHVYKAAGTFNLRAQGMANCTGEARARVTVKGAPPPPSAAPSPVLTRVVVAEQRVEPRVPVNITLEGTGACAVSLDFGDGNTQGVGGSLPNTVRHAYAAPGRYTIVATPQAPCTERRTATVEVSRAVQPQITGISVSAEQGRPSNERTIKVQGRGYCSYELQLGDGNQEVRATTLPDTARHNYPAGRYTLVATARPPCRGTVQQTFVVENARADAARPGRVSAVRVFPQAPVPGQDVTITVDGSGTCRFVVDFDDGESRTVTERLPFRLAYRYARAGDYTIVVWAYEPCAGEGDVPVRVRRRE